MLTPSQCFSLIGLFLDILGAIILAKHVTEKYEYKGKLKLLQQNIDIKNNELKKQNRELDSLKENLLVLKKISLDTKGGHDGREIKSKEEVLFGVDKSYYPEQDVLAAEKEIQLLTSNIDKLSIEIKNTNKQLTASIDQLIKKQDKRGVCLLVIGFVLQILGTLLA